MDFIRKYDIELEKEHYYAGESLRGRVVIETVENLRVTCVQLFLRGKAHVEWRITRGGERRTVKEDQYFIDEKLVVWDNGGEGLISILPRGDHRFPFEFQLPSSCLPCSFESRIGTVRYYLRVIIDIPYASPPQGLKYFTVIGPHLDCMDERYRTPLSVTKQTTSNCLCCASGPVGLEAWLEQSAYCCGEHVKVKCEIQNGSDQDVSLFCRLVQMVEFRMNKGAFGLTKDVMHQVLDFRSQPVSAHSTKSFHDLYGDLRVPVMPPTTVDVCRIIEINYFLRIGVHFEKSGDDLQIEFPFIVATVPHRLTNGHLPELSYEPADEHVEGGIYISPEFQLGQVYDGAADQVEEVILYRPVYVCIVRQGADMVSNGHSPSSQPASAAAVDEATCSSAAPDGRQQQQQAAAHRGVPQPPPPPAAEGQRGNSSSDHPAEDMGGCGGDAMKQQGTAAAATRKDVRQSPKRLSKAGVSSSASSENPECRTSGTESGGGHRWQSRDVPRSSVENNNLQRRTAAETTMTSSAETVTSEADTVRTSVTTATMTSAAFKQSTGSTTSTTTSVEQRRNVLSHHQHHCHHQHPHTDAAEGVGDQTGPLHGVKTGTDVDAVTAAGQRLKKAPAGTRSVAPLPMDPSGQSLENPRDERPSTGKTTARDDGATSAAAKPQTGSKATEARLSPKSASTMPVKDETSEEEGGTTESVRIGAKTSGNWQATPATGSGSSAEEEERKERTRDVSLSTTAQHMLSTVTREKVRTGSTFQTETTTQKTSSGKPRIQPVPETTGCHHIQSIFRTSNEERTSRETADSQTRESITETKKQTLSQKPAAEDLGSNRTPESKASLGVESERTEPSSPSPYSSASGTVSNVSDQSIQGKPPLHSGPETRIHSEIIQTASPDTNISHSTAKRETTPTALTVKEYPV